MVIAIDYGTTFTGIAFLSIKSKQNEQNADTLAEDIRIITSWKKTSSEKVPSDFSYSPAENGAQQWGYDIDDRSHVLQWTKLALEDTANRRRELEGLAKLLWEMRLLNLSDEEAITSGVPEHLVKEPEDIVTDYLGKVAEKTWDEITSVVGRHVPEQIPIDLVVTHPAKWTDRALNSTYRAVRATFDDTLFKKVRNISFVSEPEACAHYTLREAWKTQHIRFRKNDCFIVVDAGGGTVDLASYKVVDIDLDNNKIKLEQIGVPIGSQCGATFIDTSFIESVQHRLGKEDWKKLTDVDGEDNTTGGHNIIKRQVRKLQDSFDPIKKRFDGKDSKMGFPVLLPPGVGQDDNAEMGISNGALIITSDDLKQMFKHSVDKTLVLLTQAVTQIRIAHKLKVKKIFLSGGFGQSPYLFDRVKHFGRTKGIDVERGEDCWAAVAKGAIIKSLGLYTDKPLLVKSCPRHYGIKIRSHYAAYKHQPGEVDVDVEGVKWATDQLRWFVLKGDAIFPERPRVMTYDCNWSMLASEFPTAQNRRNTAIPLSPDRTLRDVVFIASSEDDSRGDPIMRFGDLSKALSEVLTLQCDLTNVPERQVQEITSRQGAKYFKFFVRIEIHVSETVQVKITSDGKILAAREVSL